MDLKEKIFLIQQINEADLREKVLVPLFLKMGYIDPIIYHHQNERGKDIVMKDPDVRFGKISYVSVVVKSGDVNGSVSGNNSYFTILNQIKQCFNEPYNHIYELRKIDIDQVIVIVSGRFLPTALDSIYGTLKTERLDKAIKEPIDCNKLISLIDRYFPEYWVEIKETKDSLRNQRDHLLNNFSKLSKILLKNEKEEQKLLDQIISSDININLFPFQEASKYVASIGYKKIDVDEISEFYTDPNIYNGYCDIKQYTFELKEQAKQLLYEIDEPVEILKKMLNEKDPTKIVDLSYDLGSYIDGYGKLDFRVKDLYRLDEFYYALQFHKTRKELLETTGNTAFYNTIFELINIEAFKGMANFYTNNPNDSKDLWLQMELIVDPTKRIVNSITFREYKEAIQLETESHSRITKVISKKSVNEDGSIYLIAFALNNYGFGDENQFPERKAKKGCWVFSKDFQVLFFETLGLEE
jgi:hypothetical protein